MVYATAMLETELKEVETIAREAGRILLEIYATDFAVDYKSKSDPVTAADRLANAHIVARLRDRFPEDGIVAEESEHNADALTRERIWYVDPLDGTKEFVAKNGEFSVMIGLSIRGRAELGVVFQPSEDKLYRGVRGQGAQLEEAGKRRSLQVSSKARGAELSLVVSRSHRPKATDALRRALGIERENSSGSVGLKIGMIATQSADLYVHMSDKSSAWDTCAPEAILAAAGGRFSDLTGGEIVYGSPDLRTRRGILACNSAAFDLVLPVVQQLARESGLLK
jgi:3'(2'), 5'-bisphosphate nucleotidase